MPAKPGLSSALHSKAHITWFSRVLERLEPGARIRSRRTLIAQDYEGLVAKDEASLNEAGPTRRWLRVKQKGWTDREDRWQRRISAHAEP